MMSCDSLVLVLAHSSAAVVTSSTSLTADKETLDSACLGRLRGRTSVSTLVPLRLVSRLEPDLTALEREVVDAADFSNDVFMEVSNVSGVKKGEKEKHTIE